VTVAREMRCRVNKLNTVHFKLQISRHIKNQVPELLLNLKEALILQIKIETVGKYLSITIAKADEH
jgi:hypothetical protein